MYDNIRIDTTQNVIIDIEKANLGDRILAFSIDSLIIAAYYISMFVIFATIFFDGLSSLFEGNNVLWILLVSIPAYLYHFLFEWLKDGQSPGKIVMKIKVVKLDGAELTFGSILLRWVFRIIDMLPFFFGMVAVLSITASKNAQRLGDMLAGTTVIKIKDRVQLHDTVFEMLDENYVPEFPEVMKLSAKDIEVIKKVLQSKEYRSNKVIIEKLHQKIMQIMQVKSDINAIHFLKKVLKDYSYFA